MVGQNTSVLHIKGPRLRDEITRGKITQQVTNPETSLSSFRPKPRLTGEPHAFNTPTAIMPQGLPRRTGAAIAVLFCSSPCSWLRTGHGRAQPLWRPVTRSTLSQRSFRVRHSHFVTAQDDVTHTESRRTAACWLHDGATSVSRRETQRGAQSWWSRQHICPAVPWAMCRFYASEQTFPMSNQELSTWTKPTHPNIYSTLYKFLNSYSNPKCAHWTMLSYFSNSYVFK